MAEIIPISEAARRFATSLPPTKHQDGQEALRFARWFGERPAADVRPVDLESYVDSFGATDPKAGERADALKSFLAFAHKQGIMPERLVSHVRVRRPAQRARAGAVAQGAPDIRITTEGLTALRAELDSLVEQRPRIAAELRAARSDGDVRENAPLDAARETQGQLEARIRELEAMLRNAVIFEDKQQPGDAARIGSNVIISNLATGARLTYQLVNAAEARPGTGRLSIDSPVGQAIFGHRVGEEVQVAAPSGIVRFRIDQVEG